MHVREITLKVNWRVASVVRFRWERRLGRIGKRSVFGKPRLMTNPDRIFIGDDVFVRPWSRLEVVATVRGSSPSGQIIIADHVQLEDFIHIAAAEEVTIGEGTVIGSHAYVTDHDHGSPKDSEHILTTSLIIKPTRIGRGVWVGEGACILKGVTVGDGAVIGAGAVVTKDVASRAVVAGVPAREIRAP
jgi:acetyltransferase-like isoleucine patch superfamily enzyme